MNEPPDRKWRRLDGFDYTARLPYFVTICTEGRKCVFGSSSNGQMRLSERGLVVIKCWNEIPEHREYVELDAFVVMPNHVHAIFSIVGDVGATLVSSANGAMAGPARGSLGAIVGAFKACVSRKINKLRPGFGDDLWQRNYYDHIIRTPDALHAIRDYIVKNPANWPYDEHNPEVVRPALLSDWILSLYPEADDTSVAPT